MVPLRRRSKCEILITCNVGFAWRRRALSLVRSIRADLCNVSLPQLRADDPFTIGQCPQSLNPRINTDFAVLALLVEAVAFKRSGEAGSGFPAKH